MKPKLPFSPLKMMTICNQAYLKLNEIFFFLSMCALNIPPNKTFSCIGKFGLVHLHKVKLRYCLNFIFNHDLKAEGIFCESTYAMFTVYHSNLR